MNRLFEIPGALYTLYVTLVIHKLAHRYGEVEALRGISAAAATGKITAILGPNAAGKSTLLRCIIGAIRPLAGAALIDGKAAHQMSAYHLAQKIAYVPQRSTVSASFTVREVVELGRYALAADRAIVDAAIARLELKDIEDRPYPALSVGQQQRVTLARAIAQLGNVQTSKRPNVQREHWGAGSNQSAAPNIPPEPSTQHPAPSTPPAPSTQHSAPSQHPAPSTRLLILDEPMSAMDLRHVRDTVFLLRELANAGVTILIAMHDLALAARMADDAWLLHDGRLAAAGPASEVLRVELLREVFGVSFEWGRREDGARVLVSEF